MAQKALMRNHHNNNNNRNNNDNNNNNNNIGCNPWFLYHDNSRSVNSKNASNNLVLATENDINSINGLNDRNDRRSNGDVIIAPETQSLVAATTNTSASNLDCDEDALRESIASVNMNMNMNMNMNISNKKHSKNKNKNSHTREPLLNGNNNRDDLYDVQTTYLQDREQDISVGSNSNQGYFDSKTTGPMITPPLEEYSQVQYTTRKKLANIGQMSRNSQKEITPATLASQNKNNNNIIISLENSNREEMSVSRSQSSGNGGTRSNLNLNLNSININSPQHLQFDTSQQQSQQQSQRERQRQARRQRCCIRHKNKIRLIAIGLTSIITIIATINKLCNDKYRATNFSTITLLLTLIMGFCLLLMLIISQLILCKNKDQLSSFGFECNCLYKYSWILLFGRLRTYRSILFIKSLLFLLKPFLIWFANNPLHWITIVIQIAAMFQMLLLGNLTFSRKIYTIKSFHKNNSNNNGNNNEDTVTSNNYNSNNTHKASSLTVFSSNSTFGLGGKNSGVCCGRFSKWQLFQKSYIITFTTAKFGSSLILLQTIYFCVIFNGSDNGAATSTTNDSGNDGNYGNDSLDSSSFDNCALWLTVTLCQLLWFLPSLWYHCECVIFINQIMKQYRSQFNVKFNEMESNHDLFGPSSSVTPQNGNIGYNNGNYNYNYSRNYNGTNDNVEAPIAIAMATDDLNTSNTSNASNTGSNNNNIIGNITTNANTTPMSVVGNVSQSHTPVKNNTNNSNTNNHNTKNNRNTNTSDATTPNTNNNTNRRNVINVTTVNVNINVNVNNLHVFNNFGGYGSGDDMDTPAYHTPSSHTGTIQTQTQTHANHTYYINERRANTMNIGSQTMATTYGGYGGFGYGYNGYNGYNGYGYGYGPPSSDDTRNSGIIGMMHDLSSMRNMKYLQWILLILLINSIIFLIYFLYLPGYYSKFLNVYDKKDHPFIITLIKLNIIFPLIELFGVCLGIVAIQ